MGTRWSEVAIAAGLADADGSVRPTIFAEMSALASSTGAANLGQGFPDEDGPEWIRELAVEAIRGGVNQYSPGRGAPELRRAIAEHQRRYYDIELDPETEILVTAGATEALASAVLALAGQGDEVITLEPFYDSHAAAIAMSGARHVTVPLLPGDGGFRLDLDALDRAVSERTRLILVNSPHNPTGTVLNGAELAAIAEAAKRADAIVVTDEVYEHLLFDGATHTPIATLPGMRERTLTVSSSGKTFSLTGWKIGWIAGPHELIDAAMSIKQFLTYVNGAPFQPAIAQALVRGDDDIAALRASLEQRKELLIEGLQRAGFATVRPQGTYFVCADASPFIGDRADASPFIGDRADASPFIGDRADASPFMGDASDAALADGAAFARWLPEHVGVACVPLSAFCRDGSDTARSLANWVRFTFVKDEMTLRTAIERLGALSRR